MENQYIISINEEIDRNNIIDDVDILKLVTSKLKTTSLEVRVIGQGYQSSFPASFAQSIIEIQNNLYHAVSFALFGEDNLRRFSNQHKKDYELDFIVSQGSTKVKSDYANVLKHLLKIMENMPPKYKVLTLMTVCGLVVGSVNLYHYFKEQNKTERFQIKEQNKTERLVHFVDRLFENQEKNTQAILKGVKGADSVVINRQTYNKQEIDNANQRAENIPYDSVVITEFFRIIAVRNSEDISKFTITSAQTGEISCIFDAENFEQEYIDSIWEALKQRSKIKLTIQASKQNNQIKQAVVIDF